jgi:hypothetical protein
MGRRLPGSCRIRYESIQICARLPPVRLGPPCKRPILSIILGLAITQVLQGLRGLILTRAKVKLYIPTLIWAGLTLLIAIQGWWASFGMRTHANWTFVALLVIVLQAITVYMVAAVLPLHRSPVCAALAMTIQSQTMPVRRPRGVQPWLLIACTNRSHGRAGQPV